MLTPSLLLGATSAMPAPAMILLLGLLVLAIVLKLPSTVSSVSQFGNWYAMTREARLFSADEIQNEACLRSTSLGDALGGRSTRRTVRGGTHIEERIRLRRQSNFSKFRPGAPMQSNRNRSTYKAKWPFAHYRNNYPLTEWEIDFNEGDRLAQFKRFRPTIDDELMEDHWTGIELQVLWGLPNSSTMEGLTIEEPDAMTILCYITENTAGANPHRPPSWGDVDIAGIDPDEFENWRNVVSRYTPGAMDDPDTGIFAAMADAYTRCQFRPPPQLKKVVDTDLLENLIIYTNDDGKVIWENQMRAANSITRRGPNDPGYEAEYKGRPIKNIDALNTVVADEDPATGLYTSQPFPAGSPRYIGVNWKWIFPVFHPLHYARVTMERGGAQQPGTEVLIQDSSVQTVCVSRRKQFRVAPNAGLQG